MQRWVQIRIGSPDGWGPGGLWGRDAGAVSEARLPVGADIRIGRRAGLELELPFSTVSHEHSLLRSEGSDRWSITDLGSRNGTWVEGRRLASGEPYQLGMGQSFRVADIELTLSSLVDADGAPTLTQGTTTIARQLVTSLFRAIDGAQTPRLVFQRDLKPDVEPAEEPVGEGDGSTALELSDADRPFVVGRGNQCALILTDESISREHASFERRWDGVFVRDLDSKNGVLVDGLRISGERRLRDGQTVTMGDAVLRLDDPQDRVLKQLEARVDLQPSSTGGSGRVTDRVLEMPASQVPAGAGQPASVAPSDGSAPAAGAPQPASAAPAGAGQPACDAAEPTSAAAPPNARFLLVVSTSVLLLAGCLLCLVLLVG